MTRTTTSKAPGSGTSISSTWKASLGSPSRSWRITQAAIFSGSSPGSTSSLDTSAISTAKLAPAFVVVDGWIVVKTCQVGVRVRDYVRESMEASEKKQMPLDDGRQEGTVRVLDDRIVVQDLTISDAEAARVIRERAESGEEATRSVRRAGEIGTRGLDREDTAIEVDYVRREFERLAHAQRETVEQTNQEAVERIEE